MTPADPRAKVLVTFATVLVVVSTPREAFVAFLAHALWIAALVATSGVRLGPLAARVGAVAVLALVAAGPMPFLADRIVTVRVGGLSLSREGLLVLWNALAKASLGAAALAWLAGSVPTPEILDALRRVRVPASVVTLTGFIERFGRMLGEEAGRMLRARRTRGYRPRWLWEAAPVGQLVGMLFVRTHARAERVHAAMLARGYSGSSVGVATVPWRSADWLFLAMSLALLAAVRIALT